MTNVVALVVAVLVSSASSAQQPPLAFELRVPVPAGARRVLGRAFAFISQDASCAVEPRTAVGDDQSTEQIFGADVDVVLDPPAPNATTHTVRITERDLGYPLANLSSVPRGTRYCVQGVFQPYDRYAQRADGHVLDLPRMAVNEFEGGNLFAAPGTLFSAPRATELPPAGGGAVVALALAHEDGPAGPPVGPANDTAYIKHVRLRSELLTEFWGQEIFLEACVLLPAGFDDPAHAHARYPSFVYQGHYHADFATPAAFSEEPPDPTQLSGYELVAAQYAYWLYGNWSKLGDPGTPFHNARGLVITLKHPTPYYDDSYAVNTASMGPYGDALVAELLPHVEARFRGIGEGWARALYGGSTGGWESLAVQIFYPELFNGCWSSCPDPVSFRAFTNVDIYADANAYYQSVDKWKRTERPAIRDHASNEIWPGYGNPLGLVQATQKEVGQKELVFGTRSRSTQQWDIWEATFSPLGEDGYPARIWDKRSGAINHTIAAHWRENFDLTHILQRDWHAKGLGKKLEGKIHVFVGASDTYYLNDAVFYLEDALRNVSDPAFGGVVEYGAHDGRGYEHCFSGDDTVPNSIGRLTINERVIPQMVARMVKTAPAGADVTSWRY